MSKQQLKSILDENYQLCREKRYSEAELMLHEALAQCAPHDFAYNILQANLADVMFRQGNLVGARDMATTVLEKVPHQDTALTVLGLVALEEKRSAEAVENLQRAYEIYAKAFLAGRLARALELDGRIEEALTLLRKALERFPADNYLTKQYRTMVEKERTGQEARKHIEEALAGNITEEDFLPYAEQIRARLGDLPPTEAAAELQKLLRVGKRKGNLHLHLLLGDLLHESGDDEKAAQAYHQARELDPQNMLALSKLLYSYRRLGRKQEAWPLLKLLLYHQPADNFAKSSLIKDAGALGLEEETALFFEELLKKYPHRKELYGAIRKLKSAAEKKTGE